MAFVNDMKMQINALLEQAKDFFDQFELYVLISSGLVLLGLIFLIVGLFI